MRRAARIGQRRDPLGGQVAGRARVELEAPDVALQVARVDPLGGVVVERIVHPGVDAGEPARVDVAGSAGRGGAQAVAAHAGADAVQDDAGLRVDLVQVALAVAGHDVVVARGQVHHPLAVGHPLRDDRVAEGIADVAVLGRAAGGNIRVGLAGRSGSPLELPQRLRVVRIGDVERVVAAPAGVQAAHQDGVPVRCRRAGRRESVAEADVPDHRRAVDIVLVRVRDRREVLQARHDHARNVSPALGALAGDRVGVQRSGKGVVRGDRGCNAGGLEVGIVVRVRLEGVQHAVVRGREDRSLARGVGAVGQLLEVLVVRVGADVRACVVLERRRLHICRLGIDDVAQQVDAVAVQVGSRGAALALVRRVAAQVVDEVLRGRGRVAPAAVGRPGNRLRQRERIEVAHVARRELGFAAARWVEAAGVGARPAESLQLVAVAGARGAGIGRIVGVDVAVRRGAQIELRLRRPQRAIGDESGAEVDRARLEVAGPLHRLVLSGEGEVVAGHRLQVGGRGGRPGADSRLQRVDRLGEAVGQVDRVPGAEERAAPVHRGMPEVVERGFTVGGGHWPVLHALLDVPEVAARRRLVVGIVVELARETEADGERRHVLERGRVLLRRRHVVVEIGPQVGLVVVHRDVGERIGRARQPAVVGSDGACRVAGVHVVLVADRVARQVLALAAVPVTVGHQDRVVRLARVLDRARVHAVVDARGDVGVVAPDARERLAQRRAAVAAGAVDLLVPEVLLVARACREVVDLEVTVGLHRAARVDGDETDAVLCGEREERPADRRLRHGVARAVVGVPVGEVGHLLVVGAARAGAIGPSGRFREGVRDRVGRRVLVRRDVGAHEVADVGPPVVGVDASRKAVVRRLDVSVGNAAAQRRAVAGPHAVGVRVELVAVVLASRSRRRGDRDVGARRGGAVAAAAAVDRGSNLPRHPLVAAGAVVAAERALADDRGGDQRNTADAHAADVVARARSRDPEAKTCLGDRCARGLYDHRGRVPGRAVQIGDAARRGGDRDDVARDRGGVSRRRSVVVDRVPDGGRRGAGVDRTDRADGSRPDDVDALDVDGGDRAGIAVGLRILHRDGRRRLNGGRACGRDEAGVLGPGEASLVFRLAVVERGAVAVAHRCRHRIGGVRRGLPVADDQRVVGAIYARDDAVVVGRAGDVLDVTARGLAVGVGVVRVGISAVHPAVRSGRRIGLRLAPDAVRIVVHQVDGGHGAAATVHVVAVLAEVVLRRRADAVGRHFGPVVGVGGVHRRLRAAVVVDRRVVADLGVVVLGVEVRRHQRRIARLAVVEVGVDRAVVVLGVQAKPVAAAKVAPEIIRRVLLDHRPRVVQDHHDVGRHVGGRKRERLLRDVGRQGPGVGREHDRRGKPESERLAHQLCGVHGHLPRAPVSSRPSLGRSSPCCAVQAHAR